MSPAEADEIRAWHSRQEIDLAEAESVERRIDDRLNLVARFDRGYFAGVEAWNVLIKQDPEAARDVDARQLAEKHSEGYGGLSEPWEDGFAEGFGDQRSDYQE